MTKPNLYGLGSTPEIDIYPKDQNNAFFIPTLMRLSIKKPDGTVITVSGSSLTLDVDHYYYIANSTTIVTTAGWYEYEAWISDATGRQIMEANGFAVVDIIE
jgi:hypothetical protein